MAEAKTSKPRTPKAKPTPPGQGSMDFSKPAPWGKPGAGTPRAGGGISAKQSERIAMSFRTQSNATSRQTGTNTYSRTPIGRDGKPTLSGTPKYSSVSPEFNATSPRARVVTGDRTVTNPGAPLVPSRQDPKNKNFNPSPGRTPSQSPSTKFSRQQAAQMPEPIRINKTDYVDIGDRRYRTGGPRQIGGTVPPAPPTTKALATIDDFADASKAAKGVKGLSRRGKGRLLGLGVLAAGLGTGYLLTRNRNQNEADAKPTQKTTDLVVPGRNAPPSLGNAADRALYPPASDGSGSGGSSSSQSSLSDRVRGNNKANRNPTEYLGEAFDATVKRGRDVGRKHLQGMLVRDSVDDATARNLIARYDKEIGSQKTLRDYKSEGIAQKFDRENPGKAGRILDEYRAMGRSADAAPAGATYKDIKARALR